MGGRASLILVVGFAVIFGYINLNLARITSSAAENMVGYNLISQSRIMANIGANVGLAVLTADKTRRGTLASQDFTSGTFNGCGYIVSTSEVLTPSHHLYLNSVSTCTTFFKTKQAGVLVPYILHDSVVVRYDYDVLHSFSSYGWMSQHEGNVNFASGDTLWGKVHSNSTINIDGKPVFWGKVTTSGNFNPTSNSGKFKAGKEVGVAPLPFPSDFSALAPGATNKVSTRNQELWVTLNKGTSAQNDGFAYVRTGSFTGTVVDSIPLSDTHDNVIYSQGDIHVKGTLDGRLTIAADNNHDVLIEGSVNYQTPPNPIATFPVAAGQTKDMLGIVADRDVRVTSAVTTSVNIDAAIFARTGSFKADEYDQDTGGAHPTKFGYINLIGSITQNNRGAVGQVNGSGVVDHGFSKSYHFDPRFDPSAGTANLENYFPPSFPGYPVPTLTHIGNWWESSRVPLDPQNFY